MMYDCPRNVYLERRSLERLCYNEVHSHVVDDISHDHKLSHGRDFILILLLDVEGFMFIWS